MAFVPTGKQIHMWLVSSDSELQPKLATFSQLGYTVTLLRC